MANPSGEVKSGRPSAKAAGTQTTRAKAAHGQGSIKEVEGRSGVWDCTILATAPTGQKKRLRKTFKGTKTAARRAMQEMKVEFEKGRLQPVTRRDTVADLMRAYLEDRAAADLRDRTLTLERQYVNRYILPVAGGWTVERVLPGSIVNELLAPLQQGKEGSARPMLNTARKVHGILRRAFAYAEERMGLERNPAATARRPVARRAGRVEEIGEEIGRAYSQEQATRLMAALKRQEHKAFSLALQFALLTGMRRGEVFGLKWADASLGEAHLADAPARITVRRTLSTGGQRRYENAPKTAAGRRTLILSEDAGQCLRRQYHTRTPDAQRPDAYVFGTKAGGPQSPDNVLRALKAFCGEAEVPYLGMHALRHTWATLSLEAGQPPAVVSAYLGHDMSVTLKTYAHLFRQAVPAVELRPTPGIL